MPTLPPPDGAIIVTGPTSGFGRIAALELVPHGQVILVGRDAGRLAKVKTEIDARGGRATAVVCDLSDLGSVRRAAAEIVALRLPIAGLVNNAGVFPLVATQNAEGWDTAFVTNHVGPFVFTEVLLPHLPDGANVLFVVSAAEDPARRFAVSAGFRGGRYISAEASAHGQWQPGGSTLPGGDAYATSKQAILAAAMEFARENPRLHINALEPGFTPNTGLGRDANLVLRVLSNRILPLLAPFIRYMSTPQQAGALMAKIITDRSGQTGVYFDERGQPMLASEQVRDPAFRARVVAETRALLATTRQ